MSATIKVGNVEATISEWVWSCKDKTLESLLNGMLDPLGPSGADPAPDLHAAQAAVGALGGEVISYDETDFVEGRVY